MYCKHFYGGNGIVGAQVSITFGSFALNLLLIVLPSMVYVHLIALQDISQGHWFELTLVHLDFNTEVYSMLDFSRFLWVLV